MMSQSHGRVTESGSLNIIELIYRLECSSDHFVGYLMKDPLPPPFYPIFCQDESFLKKLSKSYRVLKFP